MSKNKLPLKTVELFAGVGGFHLGLDKCNTDKQKSYEVVEEYCNLASLQDHRIHHQRGIRQEQQIDLSRHRQGFTLPRLNQNYHQHLQQTIGSVNNNEVVG